MPTGGVQTGNGSTAGEQHLRLLALGGLLLLAAVVIDRVRRRRGEGAELDSR